MVVKLEGDAALTNLWEIDGDIVQTGPKEKEVLVPSGLKEIEWDVCPNGSWVSPTTTVYLGFIFVTILQVWYGIS
nr:hypothetical protein CFP56_14706 [Quercus suber]